MRCLQLCGACEPNYAEWNGKCVDCSGGTNGGLVFLIILLGFAYVLIFHRLSQSSSGDTQVLVRFLGVL